LGAFCSGVSTGASGGVYGGDSVIRSMAGKSLQNAFSYKVEQVGCHWRHVRRRYTPLSVFLAEVLVQY